MLKRPKGSLNAWKGDTFLCWFWPVNVSKGKGKLFVGFPPSGLSGIALCFTLFENWFIYTVFKFPNEKYLSKKKKKANCIYSPKGICAVVNTPWDFKGLLPLYTRVAALTVGRAICYVVIVTFLLCRNPVKCAFSMMCASSCSQYFLDSVCLRGFELQRHLPWSYSHCKRVYKKLTTTFFYSVSLVSSLSEDDYKYLAWQIQELVCFSMPKTFC